MARFPSIDKRSGRCGQARQTRFPCQVTVLVVITKADNGLTSRGLWSFELSLWASTLSMGLSQAGNNLACSTSRLVQMTLLNEPYLL